MKLLDRIQYDPTFYAIRIFMLLVVLLVVMFGLFGCATTKDGLNPDGSFTYTLSPEQVAKCKLEGGCSTVTNEYEVQLVREAAKHFCGVDI